MPGLRELHKGRRRRAILDAARTLLREGGPDALTVEALAARAEVAPATVYNLVGPRDVLYTALLDDLLDQLADHLSSAGPADPLDRARVVIDESARLFVADPAVWRAVIARLGPAPHHRPSELIAAALAEADDAGLLHPSADPEALGTLVLMAFTGALLLWACGQADDAQFVALARAGLDLALAAALADEDARTARLAAASTAACPSPTAPTRPVTDRPTGTRPTAHTPDRPVPPDIDSVSEQVLVEAPHAGDGELAQSGEAALGQSGPGRVSGQV